MIWVAEKLEEWTIGRDDKVIAWTLGIGWACAGGSLAGECLVFAKATLVSSLYAWHFTRTIFQSEVDLPRTVWLR